MDIPNDYFGVGPWSRRRNPYPPPKRQPITRQWVADMLERAMAAGVSPTPPAPSATRSQAQANHDARVRALELAGWDHQGAELWLRGHPGPEFCPIHSGQNMHSGSRRGRIEER